MANKTLKTIEVGLIGFTENSESVSLTFADTVDNPNASYMLDSFSRDDIMHGVDSNDKEIYIPFHAVDHIAVTEQTASVPNRPDPYGCERNVPCTVAFSGTLTATKPSSSSGYAITENFNFTDFSHNEIKITIGSETYVAEKLEGQWIYAVNNRPISVLGQGETQVTASQLTYPDEGTYSVKIEICE